MEKTLPRFNDNALVVLKKRYLQPGESPEQMLERVSLGNTDYYELMARLDFLPNSPTLFNLGTGTGTASACFKFDPQDSMDSIMAVGTKAAKTQKWGGGVGYYLGNLRPKGALVKGTGNHAGGPVIFLKMYNAIGLAITQSGKREAAQMAILPSWHQDIQEFIHCKDEDPDSIRTFNISVSCTDEFMQKIIDDSKSEEAQLFEEIVASAWKTGDPGLYFYDRAERDNPTPHLGHLTGTNPCGEVSLLDNEPCNLGSINLRNFVDVKKKEFDWKRLGKAVDTAIRFLDDILDANQFPDPDITAAAYETRKLGLGVMGWADALTIMNIDYESKKAVNKAKQVMEYIQEAANVTSQDLADEKSPYPGWREESGFPKRRNATVTCIAPTGTISILAGVSSGIEPHFRLKWTREMGDGTILDEEATVLSESNGFIPKTADKIHWKWHVEHQAAFQEFTELAASKTINLPNEATLNDIRDAYIMMWKLGCKGGTIFRDGCREKQVLRDVETAENKFGVITDVPSIPNGRKKLPKDVETVRHKMTVGDMEAYLFAGKYEDGSPGELFITTNKEGTTIDGLFDTIAILTSLALQSGISPEQLVAKFAGTRFEPSGMTGNPAIPIATSPVDYIYRWLDKTFKNGNGSDGTNGYMFCPDCNGSTILIGGCLTCADETCGFSKCG